jgi:hypothetical protein
MSPKPSVEVFQDISQVIAIGKKCRLIGGRKDATYANAAGHPGLGQAPWTLHRFDE